MTSQPDTPGLADLQQLFTTSLRAGERPSAALDAAMADCIVDDGIPSAAHLQVYRNNVRAMFEGALSRTYPVLRRRVGEPYFATLVAEYRGDHPSRSGDLHWTGRHFPDWIGSRMAGTEYGWLGDLARLEWACEEAMVSTRLPAVPADSLARLRPDELSSAVISLQPGLRTVASRFPVWSVWQENQPGSPGNAVDPALGPQQVVVAPVSDGLVLHSLPEGQFRFVEQLSAGRTLEQALDASGLAVERLGNALALLFAAGLVTGATRSDESFTKVGPT